MLNAPILFQHLQRYFVVQAVAFANNPSVKAPMFYNKFFRMDNHIILLTANELAPCLEKVNNSVIICTNRLETIPETGTNDLIVLDDIVAQPLCYNIVNHILEEQIAWENNLNQIVFKKGSFHDMVNLIASRIELPVALTDVAMNYIAYSDDSAPLLSYVDEHNSIPTADAGALLQNPEFLALENRKGAFVFEAGMKCVYLNLFHEGKYIGRLTTVIDKEKLPDILYIEAVFNQVGPFLELLYSQYGSFQNRNTLLQHLHDVLTSIFDVRPINQTLFTELLTRFGANDDDEWELAVLLPRYEGYNMHSASYICNQIEHEWPGCISLYYGEMLFVLVDLSLESRKRNAKARKKNTTWDMNSEFHKELAEFAEMFKFDAGISRPMKQPQRYDTVLIARDQASFALKWAKLHSIPDTMNFFDRYALDFLISSDISNAKRENICHPALLILSEYDEEHNTSYLETLRCFVRERYNAVAAAKQLYIHRSSFINRMNRINELVTIDFEKPEERLYLEASLYLYFQ